MKVLKVFPGIILSVGVALLACWLESLLPIHLIGSAVIAMFIGMVLNHFLRNTKVFASGLKFTSKKILKFAIILLGCKFEPRCKDFCIPQKMIEEHTDEHCNNGRANKVDRQQTFKPARKKSHTYG